MSSLWLSESESFSYDTKNYTCYSSDVCVIGAGIFGISCAYYLSKAGLNVTVLEKDSIANKTTGHTTAKITSQHGLFYTYLLNSYGEKFAKDYLFSNQQAIKNITTIINKENINCDLEKKSNFVYTTNLNDVKKIKKEASVVNSLGFSSKFVTDCSLPFKILGAIEFENQAQFNPIKYINGLCNCILKNNSKIHTNTCVYDIKKNANTFSVLTSNGILNCKYVILASHYPFINFPGLYFFKMYQSTSYVIGIETDKTLFNGMYISSSDPVISLRTAFYKGKKIVLLGGYGHKTGSNTNSKNSYEELCLFANKIYPNNNVLFKWNTRDCITLDKIPYIGNFSNTTENLFIGTGFNKWGMTTSNVAANIICDKILNKNNSYSYLFDSTRFNPIKNRIEVKNLLSESINSLALKKIKHSNICFDDIPYNSGGIVDIDNKKVGIYKDISRKYFCC